MPCLDHVVVVLQEVQLLDQFLIGAREPVLSDKPLPIGKLNLILGLFLLFNNKRSLLLIGNLLLDVFQPNVLIMIALLREHASLLISLPVLHHCRQIGEWQLRRLVKPRDIALDL